MTSEESSKLSKLLKEFNKILETEDIDKFIYFFSKKISEEIYLSFIYITIKNNKLLFIKEIIDNPVLVKVKKVLIDLINSINSSDMNFLFICCFDTDKIEILKLLLKLPDINVNIQDKNGWTPLYIACTYNKIDIVKLLLEQPNIDVNIKDKNTPLHIACDKNYTEIVKLLLTHPNTDVNIKDKNGWTPLHYACTYNRIEIVKLLLEHTNIDVNIQDDNEKTPLYRACGNNYIKIVRLLSEHPKITIDFNIMQFEKFKKNFKKNVKMYILVKNIKKSSSTKINQILDTIKD